MAKKIFDILPSKELEKEEVKKPLLKKRVESKFRFGFPIKKSLILILLVLITVGIFAYFSLYLSRAEIEIWPETEIVSFKTKLTANEKVENINFSTNLIPATNFQEEKTFSQEFPSSGKKLIEKKAEGVIRVFNDSQQERILVAHTRFQPALEKFRSPLETGENPWFLIQERIVIPPKSYKDVKVIAAAPGEKYNIEPSSFSIPGLVGHPQYTFVYGKSFKSMSGGLKKEVPEVTQKDLKEAEKILKEKAVQEIKNVLIDKIPPEFIVLNDQILTEILETFSLAYAGAELEKFTFQVKARAKVISFKKEDLESFSKEFITSKIPADKKIDQKSLKIEYLPETINLETGKIVFSLDLGAKIYSDIDKVSLKQALSRKSLTEAQLFLKNQPEIKEVKVKLWPFWVKRVPENPERIKIKEIVD